MPEPKAHEVPAYLQAHTVRLCQNLARVDSLIDLHSSADALVTRHHELPSEVRRGSEHRPPDVDDVLRAAIVLLHASLEDFLRTIASAHLPRTNQELLKNVGLAGTGNLRQTKYGLGDLIAHRGKTVDEVIEESIDQWLHQQSFNNATDLALMLSKIGIDPEMCNQSFAILDHMITRRHRIVHNADRSPDSNDPDAPETLPIERDTVHQWRDGVEGFAKNVLYRLQFVVEEGSHN